jgi:hypothetical protein
MRALRTRFRALVLLSGPPCVQTFVLQLSKLLEACEGCARSVWSALGLPALEYRSRTGVKSGGKPAALHTLRAIRSRHVFIESLVEVCFSELRLSRAVSFLSFLVHIHHPAHVFRGFYHVAKCHYHASPALGYYLPNPSRGVEAHTGGLASTAPITWTLGLAAS